LGMFLMEYARDMVWVSGQGGLHAKIEREGNRKVNTASYELAKWGRGGITCNRRRTRN
jgi:hypothetical protein